MYDSLGSLFLERFLGIKLLGVDSNYSILSSYSSYKTEKSIFDLSLNPSLSFISSQKESSTLRNSYGLYDGLREKIKLNIFMTCGYQDKNIFFLKS